MLTSLQPTGFTFSTCHHVTLWALTPLISPLPRVTIEQIGYHLIALFLRGGIVSVALSLGLPPVAVSDCRILCCPDFPLAKSKRSSSGMPTYNYSMYNYYLAVVATAMASAATCFCSRACSSRVLFTIPSAS